MASLSPLQSSALGGAAGGSGTGYGGRQQQLMQRFRANTSQLKHKFGQAKSLSLSHSEFN
ncbi:GD11411 [Drosophila simulans]|nr:GD11411 [Drosophila simulans]